MPFVIQDAPANASLNTPLPPRPIPVITSGQGINESNPRSLTPSAPRTTPVGTGPAIASPDSPVAPRLSPSNTPLDADPNAPMSPATPTRIDPSGGTGGGGGDGGGTEIDKVLKTLGGLLTSSSDVASSPPIALPIAAQGPTSSPISGGVVIGLGVLGLGGWFAYKRGWFGGK